MFSPFGPREELKSQEEEVLEQDTATAELSNDPDANVLDVLGDRPLVDDEVDQATRLLNDVAHEGLLHEVSEMATTSSGELGKLSTLEEMVDENFAARYGSRTYSLSDEGQMNDDLIMLKTPEELAAENGNMPFIGVSDQDHNVGVMAIYDYMANMLNMDEDRLNQAMAAGGVDDNRSTLSSFYEIAGSIPFIGQYIQALDNSIAQGQIEAGQKDVDPVVGTKPEVEVPEVQINSLDLNPNDPRVDPNIASGPKAPGMA